MPDSHSPSGARQIGRGALWIMAAKAWFTLSGMLLLVALPRLGGSSDAERAATFGAYSVAIAILNPLTMMMVQGALQAFSKWVSEDSAHYRALLGRPLRLQAAFGIAVAALFALLAPVIADFLQDDRLVTPLRFGAIVIAFYAPYAALIGGFNGLRLFHRQAQMDITFSTLKITLILAAFALGFGASGALAGFALTAVLMTALAGVLAWRITPSPSAVEIPFSRLFRFQAWIMAFALVANLLMNVDLYLVKALIPDEIQIAVYAAALQVARLPYVAVISITFVLFPLVSNATALNDIARARETIREAGRYALLLVGLAALTLAAVAGDVLTLLFPALYAQGAPVLAALAVAYIGYSLLSLYATILSGAGHPARATAWLLATLALTTASVATGATFGGLLGAALGHAAALLVGSALMYVQVRRLLHADFPLGTAWRLLAASVPVFALGSAWEASHLVWIVVKTGVLGVLFVALLALLGTFTATDRERLRRIVARR